MFNETGSMLNDSILIEKVCTALNVLKLLAVLTAFSRELFSQKVSIVDVDWVLNTSLSRVLHCVISKIMKYSPYLE